MGFLDKAKAAAEQAAAKAKEGVDDVQTKRDLATTYSELGKATYDLAKSGELSHPGIDPLVEKIRALETKQPGEPVMAGATASATTEPPPSDQPPAMPT